MMDAFSLAKFTSQSQNTKNKATVPSFTSGLDEVVHNIICGHSASWEM